MRSGRTGGRNERGRRQDSVEIPIRGLHGGAQIPERPRLPGGFQHLVQGLPLPGRDSRERGMHPHPAGGDRLRLKAHSYRQDRQAGEARPRPSRQGRIRRPQDDPGANGGRPCGLQVRGGDDEVDSLRPGGASRRRECECVPAHAVRGDVPHGLAPSAGRRQGY